MRRLATALLATIVVACGATAPAATSTASGRVTAAATPAATGTATPPATAAATTSLTPSRPAFLTYAFTNVRDGSKFTLSDFAGKSVLVIGMAVW